MKCGFENRYLNFRASISDKEIDDLKRAKQHYSDCYLMTSLESLSNTENGRKILKKQIEHDDNDHNIINCYLYNDKGKREKYSVPANVAVKNYEGLYKHQKNDIIRCMDISVAEYENKYNSKPWICRISDNFKQYNFENNMPSHFLKTFTGIEPTVNIAEKDFNVDLASYRKKVMKLFERMDKDKNHSMLIGTGVKMLDGRTWHVYVLEDVDLQNDTVTVKEKRSNISRTMKVDTALNTFKYIVGYFDKDLEKANLVSQQ